MHRPWDTGEGVSCRAERPSIGAVSPAHDLFPDSVDGVRIMNKGTFLRNAKKFSKSVELGKTYYSEDQQAPNPHTGQSVLREWVFTKKSFITQEPLCGHMTATAVYMYCGGKISDKRRAGLKTAQEWSKLNNSSQIPLEGYDPPPGWTFTEGSDPEDMWDDYVGWLEDLIKTKRLRGKL